jgi:hypothetical protein
MTAVGRVLPIAVSTGSDGPDLDDGPLMLNAGARLTYPKPATRHRQDWADDGR